MSSTTVDPHRLQIGVDAFKEYVDFLCKEKKEKLLNEWRIKYMSVGTWSWSKWKKVYPDTEPPEAELIEYINNKTNAVSWFGAYERIDMWRNRQHKDVAELEQLAGGALNVPGEPPLVTITDNHAWIFEYIE